MPKKPQKKKNIKTRKTGNENSSKYPPPPQKKEKTNSLKTRPENK